MAAAIGSSMRCTERAPAASEASSRARRSTSVIPDGAHIIRRGWAKRLRCTRAMKWRSMASVTSKSAITPWRRGRIAEMLAGVRPIIRSASPPTAWTLPVPPSMATTEGSATTTPWPLRQTRVLAVPRSTARSGAPSLGMKRLRAKRRIVAAMAGAVVVTGASTGIGEASARHLSSLGFDVFAGVRKEEDADRAASNGLKAVKLDVTDPASVESARAEVEAALDGGRLAGLVNNAGVAISGPIEFIAPDELTRQLDINVVGQVRVTQAFMRLLRRHRGRVVNISSIGGRIALPLVGPYAASKFALEAVSDSLRREVRGQGIEVVLIEPGAIKTPIWGKGNAAADAMLADAPPEAEQLYGGMIRALRAETVKIEEERGLPPEEVAKVVGEAMTARKPKTRYLVGRDAKMRAALAKRLPDRVMDSLIGRALGG